MAILTREIKLQRKQGLGGSDIAGILGLSKYKTPMDIFLSKMESDDIMDEEEATPAQEWGHRLEPLVLQKFEESIGKKCVATTEVFKHPEHAFMLANMDAILEEQNAGVEIKTVHNYNMAKKWGAIGTDDLPEEYLLQCAHYCEVKRFDMFYIPVLIMGSDYREYKYRHNPELGKFLISAEKKFWSEHILKKVPPPVTDTKDALNLFKYATQGKVKIADSDIINELSKIKDLKQQIKGLEQILKEKQTEVFKFMEDAENLYTHDGKLLATWKNRASNRFDSKSCKEKYPEIYQELSKTSTSRAFLLKGERQ